MSADLHGIQALDAERAALTLPGTIPGLVQMGSRVLRLDGIGGPPLRVHAGGALLPSYTVVENFDGYLWIARARECLGSDAGQVAMDLTDATSRAHAAWWIAIRIGGAAAMRGDLPLPQWAADFTGWSIYCGEAGTLMGATWEALCHPLDALDPDDPRLLPDGSRWIDAEALRRVCLHVAGLEVTP